MNTEKIKNRKGFTLLELLVVVLIIGILAAIALPQYKYAVTKSEFATLKSNVQSFVSAEERYYMINNKYTKEIDDLDLNINYFEKECVNNNCTYYLDRNKKLSITFNAAPGNQTFGTLYLNNDQKIAYVYQHNTKQYRCVPYTNKGIRYRLCESEGKYKSNSDNSFYY